MLQVVPDLPAPERSRAAHAYLEKTAADLSARERDGLVRRVLDVLDDPRFAAAFAPGSRAEVSVAGTIALGGTPYSVAGTIDRIAVSDREVLIVDYKTNRPPPASIEAVPDAYVVQLALYRRLIQPIYPGRQVRAALLFTETPGLIDLPPALMDEALHRQGGSAAGGTPRSPAGGVA